MTYMIYQNGGNTGNRISQYQYRDSTSIKSVPVPGLKHQARVMTMKKKKTALAIVHLFGHGDIKRGHGRTTPIIFSRCTGCRARGFKHKPSICPSSNASMQTLVGCGY